ncbi:pimeloyl-ACP methyl ester carboxylesterase [Streptomyces olivoverticillatus]|uniref:Pimeloyl-ACP methyl ester carboxylesterase n=1 Tax=Streptomyces olivoverticillatus TaxID=66427 RepID=A0A7W7LNC0_9ACTN|nr:alpha/beta fold hydrolase [Streptomyces olivoverticillatus]MBB4893410.1 pimeloyl-ACP methyl ester carboxylesterase [Streptomyces olivoverticillatus]
MATRTALLEEAIPLTIDGYAYSGRIVHQPDARLAPIVLVGGAFQYQNAWGRLEQGFREVASVVTVDLPGWGGADRLPARYGFDFLAEALDQLLLKVAPGPVNVLGTSYGSAVAHRWARNHPERAGRVALVGTMAHLTEAVRDRVRHTVRMAEQGKREEFVESVLEGMVCFSPRVTISRRSTVIRCLSRALHDMSAEDLVKYRENSRRLLDHAELPGGPGVRVPVLVATGEHDPLATPALSREVAAQCADARFTTLRDADHLVHLECPEELVDLLVRFFSDAPLAGLEYCHPVERFRHRARAQLPAPRIPEGR